MKNKFGSLINLARSNIQALILLVLLTVIFVTSFQPKYDMAGWDNFSVSLNTTLNLKRGLLPTWREYRGLGVESDSEVTDVSRQLLFTALSLLFPRGILDQFYLFFCLVLGVFSMYKLAQQLLPRYGSGNKNASLIASIFYLFNLNTLITFYNPMVMYISRFALLPALILTFYKARKEPTARNLCLFATVWLFLGSSFLTATVFITVFILLTLIIVTDLRPLKTNAVLLLITLCVNAYWLGVFFDYTLNKGTSLTKASIFVEVNEIQQNKSPADFSWKNILMLKPDLQSAEPTRISDNSGVPLHPTLSYFSNKPFFITAALVFPFLFVTGFIWLLVKKERTLLWAGVVVTLFTLLSRKTLPPLGILYEWVVNRAPIFDVVFRFPDSKYYPLIAFAGSLLAGYTIHSTLHLIKRPLLQKLLVAIIILTNVAAYYPYLTGHFVNPIMFVKFPQQYFEVANAINSSSVPGRLVHLPNEKISYWKSYLWGYIGSDFLGFMLNKPIIDRTYEPASPENDQFNNALYELSKNPSNLGLIASLLKKANIKYILWDETVNPLVYSRGRKYWGTFNHDAYKEVVKGLELGSHVKAIYQGSVDISQYLGIYKDIEVLHPDLLKYLNENRYFGTTLYETQGIAVDSFWSLPEAEQVSNKHSNVLEKPFLATNTDLQQKQESENGLVYPFYLKDLVINQKYKSGVELVNISDEDPGSVNVTTTSSSLQEQAIAIKGKLSGQAISLGFFLYSPFGKETLIKEMIIPTKTMDLNIQGNVHEYASDWWILPFDQISNSRLAVDKTIIPLPPLPFYQSHYQDIGIILSENTTPTVSIFAKKASVNLNLWDFELTDKPNCYKDIYPQESYLSELNKTEGRLILTTANGSSCITYPTASTTDTGMEIIDIKPDYEVTIEDGEKKRDQIGTPTYKYISNLPTYNYIDFCLTNTVNGTCLNNHKTLTLENLRSYYIPQTMLVEDSKDTPQFVVSAIPVGLQKIEVAINSVQQTVYKKVFSDTLSIKAPTAPYLIQSTTTLQIPRILSTDSYYFNSRYDAYLTFNQPCRELNRYRTTKRLDDGFVTYLNQCDHGVGLSLNYNPQGFYLWMLEYNLLSGKNPKFNLKGGETEYKDEYVFLHNKNFPNIPGFKNIQKQSYSKNTKDIINKAPYATAYTYLYPTAAPTQFEKLLFAVTQNSQGEGLIKYRGMDIYRLPNSWAETKLEHGNTHSIYDKLDIKQIKKYLPSLWKVEVTPNPQSINKESYLLGFDQAYDKNWKLYDNIWGVIFNINEFNAEHVKMNGLTNGWVINNEQLKKEVNTAIYVIYVPERLAFMGWVVTIGTFISLAVLVIKNDPRKHKSVKI